MQEPEIYNVLHIGPETSSLHDQEILLEAKKSKLAKIGTRILLGGVAIAFFGVGASLYSSVGQNESRVDALIDEVGALSQANFQLQEQVLSQDAVLRSIEEEFLNLGLALNGGNENEIAALFTTILEKFNTEQAPMLSLDSGVTLSATEDETLDVLLLGTNGAHTDTILVVSINQEKEKISLFSIPRDLYINGRRINEYYTYYGVATLERMVESVTGLTMDHYAKIDLDGFVEVVDLLGGIDVTVTESIYDGMYPDGKGGYAAYSIEKGNHHFDGEEALRYARSRKSTSDFDRAERQQTVLAAVKTKVIQLDSVMEMKELTELFQTAITHTDTDLNVLDLASYYYDFQDYALNTGFVLTSSNYLNSMINESGAYILLPNGGNFDEIHEVISNLVN